MAEFFNRANLLQGSVAPIAGGNVSVPMDDPNNKLLAQGFGSLASRLNQFSSTAFNVAGERAKAAGAMYGARNAPTIEQVELAEKAGDVIDLPGDASSLRIYDQAAYASSLSVLEDSVEVSARRALSDSFANAAANPNMNPNDFTAELDTIVKEYSDTLSSVSPSSGAKVNASLSILANSQVVQFSREFMAKEIKRNKDDAIQNAGEFTETHRQIILSHDSNAEVTVLDKIKLGETKIRNILEKQNVRESQIKTAVKNYRKTISKAKVDAILGWTLTSEFSTRPNQAIFEVTKYADKKKKQKSSLPQYARDIWDTMDNSERLMVIGSLQKQANQFNNARRNQDLIKENENAELLTKAQSDFSVAQSENDRPKMLEAIKDIEGIDPDEGSKYRKIYAKDSGVIADSEPALERLNQLLSVSSLTYSEIANANVSSGTKANYYEKMATQRDRLVDQGRARAKDKFQPNLSLSPKNLTGDVRLQRLKFDRVILKLVNKKVAFEKDIANRIKNGQSLPSEPFDYEGVVDAAIENVEKEINKEEKSRLQKMVNTAFDKLPEGYPKDADGLTRAINSKNFDSMKTREFEKARSFIKKISELD
tara:strand:+ start:98 stop:1882 length:1785 start_codon:yes stop_codon:yes gene_type:complete